LINIPTFSLSFLYTTTCSSGDSGCSGYIPLSASYGNISSGTYSICTIDAHQPRPGFFGDPTTPPNYGNPEYTVEGQIYGLRGGCPSDVPCGSGSGPLFTFNPIYTNSVARQSRVPIDLVGTVLPLSPLKHCQSSFCCQQRMKFWQFFNWSTSNLTSSAVTFLHNS